MDLYYNKMKIKYIGHACISILIDDVEILVDPFITGNPLLKDVDIEQFNPDYILITHAHQDHVLDVEKIAKQSNAQLISNAEIIGYYAQKGIVNGHAMNTGGSFNFPFGRVTSTIAFHSSSFADGSHGGNPNGYLINIREKQIYIAGDTALTHEMKLLPKLYGKIDCSILPIGGNFTMGAKEAVLAAEFLKCQKVFGYHFDTFPPIKINHEETKIIFTKKNIELILPNIGESVEI